MFEDINNIDGKAVTNFKSLFKLSQINDDQKNKKSKSVTLLALNTSKQHIPKLTSWDHWHLGISDYHRSIKKIIQGVNQEFEALRRDSMAATNKQQVLNSIKIFCHHTDINLLKLEELSPPVDLLNYHKKIIEHIQLLDKSQEVLGNMQFDEANELLYQSQESYFYAMLELRNVFESQNAPQKIMAGIDAVLKEYDEEFK